MDIQLVENKSTRLGVGRDLNTDQRRPPSQPVDPSYAALPPTAIPDASSFICLGDSVLHNTPVAQTIPLHIRHIYLKRLIQCAEDIEIRDRSIAPPRLRCRARPASVVSAPGAIHRLDSDAGRVRRTDDDRPREHFRM